MSDHHTVEDLLARLERERLAADRLYNDALTAVDRALQVAPVLPGAPPAYDTARIADLNAEWETLAPGTAVFDRSLRGRLRHFIWRLVGPSLEAQQRFNSTLVDHINRNVRVHQALVASVGELLVALDRELRALVRFESLLIQSLQTITVYVDSKDRTVGGAEIRQRLVLNEERLLALQRLIERPDLRASTANAPASEARSAASADPFSGEVESLTYVGFEDQFRGTQDEIRRRVEDYIPLLSTCADIVDIGCGRGELLALLRDSGVTARGVDTNAAMIELCRRRGLEAERDDALTFLERQDDGSIGGLIAVQVVEHMTPGYLTAFLRQAFYKMRPGAPLILETINPACWMAFFETYLRDPTHQQPLHPETLSYLVQASGFGSVDVQFRAPVSEQDRLVEVEAAQSIAEGGVAASLDRLSRALNDHADKLNRRLFSFMDYVVIARR